MNENVYNKLWLILTVSDELGIIIINFFYFFLVGVYKWMSYHQTR